MRIREWRPAWSPGIMPAMLRFFLVFLALQLTLFVINMHVWVQQHLELP